MTVHGNLARQRARQIGEVVLVGGREQDLGRAADAKPGVGRERRVGGQAAAQVGERARRYSCRASHAIQRRQFARQRVGPLRDAAGAEANHIVARLGELAHDRRELVGRRQRERRGDGRAR